MRVIPLVSLTLVLTGCGPKVGSQQLGKNRSDHELDETTFDAAALALVQRNTGIQLPDGSRGLNMFYQGSTCIDPSFVAKIQIPESSGGELASRIKKIRHRRGAVSGSLTEKVPWWTPSSGTIRVQRQFNPGGDYVRAILSQEEDRLVLYLEWINI
jgi:hypothetical protein